MPSFSRQQSLLPSDDGEFQNYLSALRQVETPAPLTPALVQLLMPHVSPATALAIYERGLRSRTYFAGPPLLVHGALHVFGIDNTTVPQRRVIYHAYVFRRSVSFVNHPDIKDHVQDRHFAEMELAEDFACFHWGDRLHWDNATSVMCTFLVRPSLPECDSACSAWCSGEFPLMLASDDKPASELLDDAIEVASTSDFEQYELVCGRTPFAAQHCALCGGGIRGNECVFCGAMFSFVRALSPNWPYALPPRIATMLCDDGYKFSTPPIEARKFEYRTWATPGRVATVPSVYLRYGKNQRSIEL